MAGQYVDIALIEHYL